MSFRIKMGKCHAVSPTDKIIPPSFTRKLRETQVGKSLFLECTYSGTPEILVQWLKDGTEISASDKFPILVKWFKDDQEIDFSDNYDMSFRNNVVLLHIKKASYGDTGSYTCTVSNEAGTASSVWFFLIACFNIYIYIFNLLLATIKTEDLFPLF
uniref:Ig-like domain-containing protein n=1 Tax=Erpetoichthys calabaricus TaxID=27687 RepID=A0A8C4S435_ERPCA